jgi:hypothetical protein
MSATVKEELFLDATRTSGDYAGVFEHDGEVGYFYLYRLPNGDNGGKIDGAIQVVKGKLTIKPSDIEVRWSSEQDRVGLFIANNLWALFNVQSGAAYGQTHSKALTSNVPEDQIFS